MKIVILYVIQEFARTTIITVGTGRQSANAKEILATCAFTVRKAAKFVKRKVCFKYSILYQF